MFSGQELRSLEELAKIIPGAHKSFYGDEALRDTESAHVLKGVNLDHHGGFITSGMEKMLLNQGRDPSRFMLQPGDVVLLARGSAMRASFVSSDTASLKIIATSNFVIVRPHGDELPGEVIAAYFNSPAGQNHLSGLSVGAAINHIPTRNLREMKLPVPSLQACAKICDLFNAGREAYLSTIALAEQQKQASTAAILNLMTQGA